MTKTKKEQAPASAPPNPTRKLLYLGYRSGFGKDGKLTLAAYIDIEDGEWNPVEIPENQNIKGWKKPIGHERPGQLVSVECSPDNPSSVLVRTVKVIDELNRDNCVKLDALSLAAKTAERLRKQGERESKRKVSMEALEPLRRAYYDARGVEERSVLLGRVIAYITR